VDENSKAAAEGNMELFFETDEQLHQKVFELAGMARIWEVVRGTKVQLDRLRQLNLPLSVKNLELFDEHQAIVDALRSQDMELGITTIHRHSTRIFETVEELRSVYPSYFAP
jgi:DNA-binding GntR family transcriptional regulator